MQTIDLLKLIAKHKLDTNELADLLFPTNKYPRMALNRILDRTSYLDENQISKLALFIGIPISELYTNQVWKTINKKGLIIFTHDEYKAELETKTGITKLFHNDSLFHEEILHDRFIPLSEYLNKLNLLIKKFKKDENN